jgi:hypothetical protein
MKVIRVAIRLGNEQKGSSAAKPQPIVLVVVLDGVD